MKVAVIGGGSTYTPELVEGFGLRRDVLPVDELVLHDIDESRLEVVGGLAGRILDKLEFPGRLTLTSDRERAIEGADFVLVQLRVGGLAARLRDETIPPKFGCIGQETTGPGGFAKALRTVPVVLGIAEDTARLGADGAWLLDFTNPAGLVTQALIDHGHRAIGLCNIPIGFQRMLARELGVRAVRGAARARRPQPSVVGAAGDGRRRATGCRSCSRASPTSWARRSTCPATCCGCTGRSRRTTCATSTSAPRWSRSSAANARAPTR